MDEIFQYIFPIIILVVTLLSAFRRQNRQRREPEGVLDEEENGVFLPPWGNVEPVEEEGQPYPIEMTEEPTTTPQPPHTPPETPSRLEVSTDDSEIHPSDTDSAAGAQSPQVDTIAGISLSSQTVRQGIILSEILGRPKSLRRPPRQ